MSLQVKINRVSDSSPLCEDLTKLRQLYSYGYVEMELTFTMDLYPFYPPLVKLVRRESTAVVCTCVCKPHFQKRTWVLFALSLAHTSYARFVQCMSVL